MYPRPLHSQLLIPKHWSGLSPLSPLAWELGDTIALILREDPCSLSCSSVLLEVRQARPLRSVGFAPSPLTLPSFFLSDDSFFCLLHLWTHRGHPEFSIPSGSDKEDLSPLSSAPRLHVSCLHWHRRLHPIVLAHLPTGQLRAEEDVLGKGALAAPLSRNGRESEFCTFSAHRERGMKTVLTPR